MCDSTSKKLKVSYRLAFRTQRRQRLSEHSEGKWNTIGPYSQVLPVKKNFFTKMLYLGGSGPLMFTFSEIWKMEFIWSMSKFSQQKLNLLVIYCFLFQV